MHCFTFSINSIVSALFQKELSSASDINNLSLSVSTIERSDQFVALANVETNRHVYLSLTYGTETETQKFEIEVERKNQDCSKAGHQNISYDRSENKIRLHFNLLFITL